MEEARPRAPFLQRHPQRSEPGASKPMVARAPSRISSDPSPSSTTVGTSPAARVIPSPRLAMQPIDPTM
ncbi:MAG: hypothetical protein ACO4CW_09310 [Planctomycetota bacterium]